MAHQPRLEQKVQSPCDHQGATDVSSGLGVRILPPTMNRVSSILLQLKSRHAIYNHDFRRSYGLTIVLT